MFGGYSTTVPGTKTMKFIPNAEYNKSLNRAKNALQARRNAKQLAENKRKPNTKPNNNGNNAKPNNNGNVKPNNNGNVKPNNNDNKPNNNGNNAKPNNNGNVKPNNNDNKPNNNGNNAKPNNNGNVKPNNNGNVKPNNNGNVKPNNNSGNAKPNNNGNTKPNNGNVKPNNNGNNTKPNNNGNTKPNNNGNVKPNNNGNNTKPNNNGNTKPNNNGNNTKPNNNGNTKPNKENATNNFNAAAELNKQLNNEAKRQNRAKNNNTNNNFNAAAELNKQLNNESTRQLENKRKQVRNKTSKHVAGIFGRIGKWNKPIKNAKTFNNLNVINKNINKRVELKGKIEASNIPSKRELLNKVKKFNMNVNDLNKIFKKELNNSEFNAGAELNKQLNIEGNRQLKNKKNVLIKKTKNAIANPFRRIGKWNTAIKNAKTLKELNNLNKNLNNRIKLRNEIKKSVLTRDEQSEYAKLVMKFNQKTANTRKRFENGVNKKISNTTGPLVKGILNKAVKNNNNRGSFNGGLRLGNNNNNIISGKPKPIYNSNSNNNVKKPNMKPNPTFEPNMTNNPTFENNTVNNKPKLTNENKKPLISAINSLKKLPQNKKTMFKGQLNRAFKNQNLNKMKAIRNEAIAANKEVLAEEKRLKEAEKAAARKAEREAKKKNTMKKQLNAANNILNLADKALKKKENNRRPTLTERGSYTSKINTQMKKLAKGTNNKVREDWEKKKRVFKGRITKATTLGQVKKAYENAKEAYNNLMKPKSMWKNEYNKRL
jgi:hypothetical protein